MVGRVRLLLLCACIYTRTICTDAASIPRATAVLGRSHAGSVHNLELLSDEDASLARHLLQGLSLEETQGLSKQQTAQSGSVIAWGDTSQIGPVPPEVLTGRVVKISAGRFIAMALLDTREVVVWSIANGLGVLDIPKGIQGRVVDIAAGAAHCLAILSGGAVTAWGANISNQTDVPAELRPGGTARAVAIAGGLFNSLALLATGRVVAWGRFGDKVIDRVSDVPLAAQANVASIAAAAEVSVAVLKNGSLVQWGLVSSPPVQQGVKSVSAGTDQVVALLRNGSVAAWGRGVLPEAVLFFSGILPDVINVPPAARSHVVAVSAAENITLALRDTGEVVAWGHEGPGVNVINSLPPATKSGVIAISCGYRYAMALIPGTVAAAPPPPPAPNQLGPSNGTIAVPSPSHSSLNVTDHNATISIVMTIPVTSQLAADSNKQLQFLSQLKAALASYFQLPTADQVEVRLQVLSALRRLLQARVPVVATVRVTAYWSAGNTSAPATLLQQARNLQQQPAAVLPTAMVQQFNIDIAQVDVPILDTSQLNISGPSVSPSASPSSVPPSNTPINDTPASNTPPSNTPPSTVASSNVPPSDEPSSSSSSKKKLSTGAIAGIAIAGVVGVAVAAALIMVIYRRRHPHPSPVKQSLQPPPQKNGSSPTATASAGASGGIVAPAAPVKIRGLSQGELFVLATAQNYKWTDSTTLPDGLAQPVEAGVNDTQLDMMLKTQQQDDESAAVSQNCPAVQLSMEELRQQVQLLSDGLLGRGATALVFKCIWPSRFGSNALLAAKVLQNGFESDVTVLSSFTYEANLLASTQHPHVVKLYGYCLEPPTVCLILELLPCSLKDVLYKTPADAASSKAASSQPVTTSAGAVPTMQASNSSMSVPTQPVCNSQDGNSAGQAATTTAIASESCGSAHKDLGEQVVPLDTIADAPATPPLKPMTLHQILRVCTDVAAGLAYLHNQPAPDATVSNASRLLSMPAAGSRIVHRDLKPANILLNSRGAAKISDFGLARQHDHTTFATMNLGAGTLPYMAPELLVSSKAGVSGAACTNRVDIYSLGIIMWELLMGQPPWKGMAATAILAAVMNRRRLPLPGDVASADREHATMEVPLLPPLPAHSHPDLPKMCQIIQACWQHRELRRPTAAALHGTLAALLQQLEQQ